MQQTSFIEISIEAGILRSGKGTIHASAGLGAVVVFHSSQNNPSDDEVTGDEELRTDPSGRRRHRLAQAARRKTAELQRTLVYGTILGT